MKLSEITTISTANKFKDNPRIITENQFNHLKEHLNDLGDLGGVVYCHKNKCFVGGNQRSTVFEGAKIEIIETFEKPTKCGTVAHGFVIYKGEKYSYREVIFSKIDFDKACIVANNDGGSFDYDMLANKWDAELLNEWGLDIPMNEQIDELEEGEEIEIPQSVQLEPPREYILIMADPNSVEWEEMKGELKLQIVRKGGYKKGSAFDTVGLERVIEWKDFKKRIDANSDTK